MQEQAVGLLGIPVMALARLLASSATFRGVVGAVTPAEAIDQHIYFLEVEDDADQQANPEEPKLKNARPRAIIDLGDGWSTSRHGPGTWEDAGGLLLTFEFVPPKEFEERRNEEAIWFLNKVGVILDEMRLSSGGSDADGNPYLNATRFTNELIGPCARSDEVEHFWGATFRVEWPR